MFAVTVQVLQVSCEKLTPVYWLVTHLPDLAVLR